MTWDEAEYETQRLAGALLDTQCPHCLLNTGALVLDDDHGWLRLACPGCRHVWEEQR